MTLDNSGNGVFAGNVNCVNVVASGTGSFSSLVTDTKVYNSGGNANFKLQSSSTTRRMEAQTNGTFYLFDENNTEIFHFRSDRQVDFQNDVNCYGTGYYVNGVFVASSDKLKDNIRKPNKKLDITKLDLKQYDKKRNDGSTMNEIGYIAESIMELDPENELGMYQVKDDVPHLNYNIIFMMAIEEIKSLRKEVDDLKKGK
jgi:hypothetical protein